MTKRYDISIQNSDMQFLYFCGMPEELLDETNHKWAPTRAYSLLTDFASLRERIHEGFKEYCTTHNSLIAQMNAILEGT